MNIRLNSLSGGGGITQPREMFLSLPQSFKPSDYDRKKLRDLGVEILFVPDHLKLGESIVYCLNLACDFDEELYILHGDTFFSTLDFMPDSLLVARVSESYNWAFLDSDFHTTESVTANNLILAGAFAISHPRALIRHIVERDYSFVDGLKAYSKDFAFHIIENNTWLDFGLITNYFHSKKIIGTQRVFNQMAIEGWLYTKTSTWSKKIEAECFWFENLPRELLGYTPRFVKNAEGYGVEYLYNNTLAELFVFGNLPTYTWRKILESVQEFMRRLHSFKPTANEICLSFDYKAKTLQRLEEFARQHALSLEQPWRVNGRQFPSLLRILDVLDRYLCDKQEFSIIHGDFCFSNIMYDFRANMIKTFDPRGMDFRENISMYGDYKYDIAKLTHSVFGLYDFIVAGFYDCKFEGDSIEYIIHGNQAIAQIQNVFLEIFSVDKEIYALVIHLFLSMLPLHNDSKTKQMAFFANTFRLYEEFFGDEI